MPYRRLPNTDQARIRTLKAAVTKLDSSDAYHLAVELKSLISARNFLPRFEAAQNFYAECYARQAKAGKKHQEHAKTARLYISHFIQVLNMAVVRAEIRTSHREYYGLDVKSNAVPDLSTEAALSEWGSKVIKGETKRIAQGGIPIYNPSIAKVRVHYDIFMESYEKQKGLQANTAKSLEKLASMREEADNLILDIWNQVEKAYEQVEPMEKRLDLCRDWGLIYYYRSGEREKAGK